MNYAGVIRHHRSAVLSNNVPSNGRGLAAIWTHFNPIHKTGIKLFLKTSADFLINYCGIIQNIGANIYLRIFEDNILNNFYIYLLLIFSQIYVKCLQIYVRDSLWCSNLRQNNEYLQLFSIHVDPYRNCTK